MNTTTETTNLYVFGIDWTRGRLANYERKFAWMTTEDNARVFFARNLHEAGAHRCALIAPDGTIIMEANR